MHVYTKCPDSPIENTITIEQKDSTIDSLNSFTIYLKKFGDLIMFVPEGEGYEDKNDHIIINVKARFFGSRDFNKINHPHIIEIQDNQSINAVFEENNLSFNVFKDKSKIKTCFINKSLYEIISGSKEMKPDKKSIKKEDKNKNERKDVNYKLKYFNELSETVPQDTVEIKQSEIFVNEEQKCLYALCSDQISAIYFSAFPFRFDLDHTLFISAPSHLKLVYELKKEKSKEITLSFYNLDNIEDNSFLLTENGNNYLFFNALMKDIPPPLFYKIALGKKRIEDISQIFIIWDYKSCFGNLMSFSPFPSFKFDLEKDPKYIIKSSKLYPFKISDKDGGNYDINIEIMTVSSVENLEHKDLNSFSLH